MRPQLILLLPALTWTAHAQTPAQKVISSRDTVFTLPKPKEWLMSRGQQNIIMCCLVNSPQKAMTWREEYKSIFEEYESVKSWNLRILRECLAASAWQEVSFWKELIAYVENT